MERYGVAWYIPRAAWQRKNIKFSELWIMLLGNAWKLRAIVFFFFWMDRKRRILIASFPHCIQVASRQKAWKSRALRKNFLIFYSRKAVTSLTFHLHFHAF